jgi:hypothetical protein
LMWGWEKAGSGSVRASLGVRGIKRAYELHNTESTSVRHI